MFSYRLRGLVNLHIATSSLIATSYFLLLALAVPYLPKLELSPSVNLLLYSVPILAGTLFSGRYWRALSPKFHAIEWIDAAAISARQIVIVALLMFGLIVATKDRQVSRLFLGFYLLSGWLVLCIANRLLPRYLAQIAFNRAHRIRALFVGSAAHATRLNTWMKQKEQLGIDVVGLLSDEVAVHQLSNVKLLGGIVDLPSIIEDRNIGQVVLLDLPADAKQTMFFIEQCQLAGCRLLIHQNLLERLPIPMVPVIEGGKFFLTIHDEPLEDPLNRAIKRIFDIVAALPIVIIVLPPLALTVAAVQLIQAPGPLFFARKRGGHRRKEFHMLKFRSMYAAKADPKLEAAQATKGDRRIYPFGAFLRKTSLDEFPQFWNVLVGDMSIVGPRPHLTQHDSEFSQVAKAYRTRQLVKPGLTGLAQIRGYRGEIRDPEMLHNRVQLDIQYITEWSVWLDTQIVLKTIVHVLFPPKNAV
jgi:exopolysaccharide biosynthesis polyprenyl glycosylphosphotransferase